jgi:spore coat polysaccharide biosynthesis protein SpsF
MNKKIGIIIYARTSSKRFPNKIFKKIIKLKMIELIIKRIKKINLKKYNYEIIVNTSLDKSDDKIVNFCKKKKIKYFRGSLNNVFKRTNECLKKNNYKFFARVNCDRPFLDFEMISKMINLILERKNIDIVSNCTEAYPRGLACEVARSRIFFNNFNLIKTKNNREHIFNFFYKNEKRFKILKVSDKLYQKNSHINLSVDKKEDLKKIIKIFKFFKNNYLISTKKVLKDIKNIKLE